MREKDESEKEIVIEKKVFQEPSPGTHPAKCIGVVDLGLFEFNGEQKRRGAADWELQDERDQKTGKLLTKREFFGLTLGKGSRLAKILEELEIDSGDRFVLGRLKGVEANIVIVRGKNQKGEPETKITAHFPLGTAGTTTSHQATPTVDPIVVERSRKEAEGDIGITDADVPF